MSEPRSHRISLKEAVEMTHAYQETHKGVKGWWFSREAIESLLATSGAGGIRIYLGEGKAGPTPVICPTSSDKRDITDGFIAEMALPCPPYCDDDSPLMNGPRE